MDAIVQAGEYVKNLYTQYGRFFKENTKVGKFTYSIGELGFVFFETKGNRLTSVMHNYGSLKVEMLTVREGIKQTSLYSDFIQEHIILLPEPVDFRSPINYVYPKLEYYWTDGSGILEDHQGERGELVFVRYDQDHDTFINYDGKKLKTNKKVGNANAFKGFPASLRNKNEFLAHPLLHKIDYDKLADKILEDSLLSDFIFEFQTAKSRTLK